jgi:hypothetical protein
MTVGAKTHAGNGMLSLWRRFLEIGWCWITRGDGQQGWRRMRGEAIRPPTKLLNAVRPSSARQPQLSNLHSRTRGPRFSATRFLRRRTQVCACLAFSARHRRNLILVRRIRNGSTEPCSLPSTITAIVLCNVLSSTFDADRPRSNQTGEN